LQSEEPDVRKLVSELKLPFVFADRPRRQPANDPGP